MALSKSEWRRRVAAACELHGIDLKDLEALDDGLPKGAARRAGHPSDTYAPNHALAMILAERLELPLAWFEDEDWRPLIGDEPAIPAETKLGLARQQQGLDMLREGLSRVAKMEKEVTALARIEARLVRLESPPVEANAPATKADLRSLEVELTEALAELHKALATAQKSKSRGAKEQASGPS